MENKLMDNIFLKEVIELISGRDLKKSQYNSECKGIPYIIGASNIKDGNLVVERWTEQPTVIGKKGDVILSVKGTVGLHCILQEEEAHLSRQVMALRVKDGFLNEYIRYFLAFYIEKLKLKAKGMIPGITREDILLAEIPNFSIDTQKKIVNVLKKSETIIKKRKAQIEALDQLTQSVFLEMFGDSFTNDKNFPIKPLSDIASVGSSKRVFVKELVDEGIPFYRGTEIASLAIGENITPTLFITKEHYKSLKEASGVPKIGDLLLPSVCPDGRIWRVNDSKPFYFKDGRVLWVNFTNNDINTIYVQYALKDKLIRDYINIASGTTGTVKNFV
ncbi:restriction endonuclease subunit S [Fervidibacillus halotolerans]|uniref:Restriction endonuclease subunit S n=1 Tax=Fervidibacillus halotolerans TaxID=2980027 RepID=A0A9E8M084_9BACI|nr:restriction endonuclease subunit S [Fervidibacillus halotolerans]WAA12622.1 restriction endonuclease subunit S [Fervidibacillus halotolerans]